MVIAKLRFGDLTFIVWRVFCNITNKDLRILDVSMNDDGKLIDFYTFIGTFIATTFT